MIKFNGLNLKDMKITDALASVANGKKIAVGSEVIWQKSVSPLPSGYRQVEYLESTGTQYIDTGIPQRSDLYMRSNVEILTTSNNKTISFGSRRANLDAAYCVFGFATPRFDFGGQTVPISNSLNVGDNVEISWEGRNIKVGETTYVFASQSFVGEQNIYIFAVNNSDEGAIYKSAFRCEDFYLYDSNGQIRTFLPCLDPNDRPCMFDLVTQQPFYNQGTGEFLYGNII